MSVGERELRRDDLAAVRDRRDGRLRDGAPHAPDGLLLHPARSGFPGLPGGGSEDPADPRRRLVTSRRFEPLDLTARLEGHKYILLPGEGQKLAARAAVQAAINQGQLAPAKTQPCARCRKPAAEWHHPSYAPGDELDVEPLCKACHQPETADSAATVRDTVRTIRGAGGAMTTPEFIAALGITKGAASMRLNAAERAGLLQREGDGRRTGPQVWRLTDGTGPRQ